MNAFLMYFDKMYIRRRRKNAVESSQTGGYEFLSHIAFYLTERDSSAHSTDLSALEEFFTMETVIIVVSVSAVSVFLIILIAVICCRLCSQKKRRQVQNYI